MRRLRDKLPEWGFRYKVPWYVLVGESGSGKTSIANAHLRHDRRHCRGGSRGVCTALAAPPGSRPDRSARERIPLYRAAPNRAGIRTSLRFWTVTRPRRERCLSADRNALRSFLRLTARYRPRQPLNGLILTIPATDLLESSSDPEHPHRLAHIADLAQRLDEIQHLTGLSLPVYVLVTKCDAINGFTSYSRSFFRESTLNRSGQNGHVSDETFDNLFGWSNPHLLDSAFSPAWVDEAFDDTNEVLLRPPTGDVGGE